MQIRLFVKCLRQCTLLQVVWSLLLVWKSAIASIEAFWEQQERADAIPGLLKLLLTCKLGGMTLVLIRNYMFNIKPLGP